MPFNESLEQSQSKRTAVLGWHGQADLPMPPNATLEGTCSSPVSDHVSGGSVIGGVGNSGDSVEPHLHFHAMSGPDPGQSSGIPTLFENWISNAYGRKAIVRSLGTIPKGAFVQP